MASIKYEDLVRTANAGLFIPEFSGEENALETALSYADSGWYVVPIKAGTKNPGSILGKNWPLKSSRDKSTISNWFKQADLGVALHTGRSNAVVLDIDHPDEISPQLGSELQRSKPPFQSTRSQDPRRGHFVFSVEPGVEFSSSNAGLGSNWGEVRAGNSVIAAYPTPHKDAEEGGRYLWMSYGQAPKLPDVISKLLRPKNPIDLVLMDYAELENWLEGANESRNTRLLNMRIEDSYRFFRSGSRHRACLNLLLVGLKDATVGQYPAKLLIDQALETFLSFKPQSEWSPGNEFVGLVRWAASAVQNLSLEELANHEILSTAYASPGIQSWIGAQEKC